MEMPRISCANASCPRPRYTSEICIKCKRIMDSLLPGSRGSAFPFPSLPRRSAVNWIGLVKMGNVIILGSQWGDEGKGKIVDLFSERFDIVARYRSEEHTSELQS